MGKIFIILGKSASGKDTIYARVCKRCKELRKIVPYTTRPKRENEVDGVDYHFTDWKRLQEFRYDGKLVEMRTYHTVLGDWHYATVCDESMDLLHPYILIGTLESFQKIRDYFGENAVVPIYVEVEAGVRLGRALEREKMQKEPKYAELCRRFLADEEDFSEEKLSAAGIEKRFLNVDVDACVESIVREIHVNLSKETRI